MADSAISSWLYFADSNQALIRIPATGHRDLAHRRGERYWGDGKWFGTSPGCPNWAVEATNSRFQRHVRFRPVDAAEVPGIQEHIDQQPGGVFRQRWRFWDDQAHRWSMSEARERAAEVEIDVRDDLGTVNEYFEDCRELDRLRRFIDQASGAGDGAHEVEGSPELDANVSVEYSRAVLEVPALSYPTVTVCCDELMDMRRGQMDIVYRVGGDGFDSVLFASRASAEYVAQIRKALYQSTTWGEFRANLPEGEWQNLEWKLEDPPDDRPFRADDIPGHADGDYPEWLRQSQLNWLPDDLIEKYDGEVKLTTLNGWVLDLPANRAEEIADDLRALGHSVEETDLDIA